MAINGFESKLSKKNPRFLLAAGGRNKTLQNDSLFDLFCISSFCFSLELDSNINLKSSLAQVHKKTMNLIFTSRSVILTAE